jgi:phospholipase/carboxylesterase
MTAALDAPVVLETAPHPSATVIWLHGLGADGNDFVPIVPELGLPKALPVRFVFPHAPMRPVTINGGYVMRAWYDITSVDRGFQQNPAHIEESMRALHQLIERECERGTPAARMVVAGFSQGGAIALHGVLRSTQSLAGAVVLSAPTPGIEALLGEGSPANKNTPIFLAHGRYDQLVPFAYGEQARTQLAAHSYAVEWHAYNVEHTVSLEEVRDIGRFLTKVLG